MSSGATVFVVDDDASLRDALRRLIESVGNKVETYASADAFFEHYEPSRPGCLVLDVRLPGTSGLQLQEELAANNIRIPVIFITAHADVRMSVRAMKNGALDFIEKPFGAQELLEAIQRALVDDEQWRGREARKGAIRRQAIELTRRERQVMDLVVAGRANKRIAATLGIAEKTVKAHRAQVMRKMRAGSLPELVRLAQQIGVTGSDAPYESLPAAARREREG